MLYGWGFALWADAFPRAWLEPLPSLRYVQGLETHADPPGVAALRSNPTFSGVALRVAH